MKIVIAIDSLKGSLSSLEAGEAIRVGVLKVMPSAQIEIRPIADGGEGTVEALTAGLGGTLQSVVVTSPLGSKISADYGIIAPNTAVIEMANAAGLPLVPENLRNPLNTTTYGVGEMICDAIKKGCRRFIVGIGGSATNDGGLGMLTALGFKFTDPKGATCGIFGRDLEKISAIDTSNILPELRECTFKIACDVTNPLCGERGASAVYGPQKGATPEIVKQMDSWLKNFAALAKKYFPQADSEYPGTGAAGGLGFAFRTFTTANLESGIKIVLAETNLEKYVRDADLIITGEGRLDAQTVMGKAPIGVAHIAKKYGKPVIAFCGSVTKDAVLCNEHGIDAFFPILRSVTSLAQAMESDNARQNLIDTAEQVFRLIYLIEQNKI